MTDGHETSPSASPTHLSVGHHAVHPNIVRALSNLELVEAANALMTQFIIARAGEDGKGASV
jgi:hypothetical protein